MASVTSVFSCLGQIAEVGYRLQHFAADEHRDQAWHNVWTRGRGAIGTIMLEEHIFKPIPEAVIEDQSRWPIFGLYDAVVRESGRATPTSLLAANATVSVTVIGRLAGTEEHADRLIHPGKVATFIELQGVRYFSYGTSESGRVILWAAGKAGWYEIHPAPEYQPIFDHMVKSVRLVHFLADSSRKRRRGGANASIPVQTTFKEYARANRSDCPDAEAAAEIFHQHSDFLIAKMLKEKGWRRFGLYHHFRSRYRRDFERIRAEHEPSSVAPLDHAGAIANGDNGDSINDMDDDIDTASSSTSVSMDEEDYEECDITSAIPEVDALMRFARDLTGILVRLLAAESGMRGNFNIDTCAGALHRHYDMPSVQHARNVLRESAPELVRLVEEADMGHASIAAAPLYMQLREIVAKSRWSTRFLWQDLVPREKSSGEGREGSGGSEAGDDGKGVIDSDSSCNGEDGEEPDSTARIASHPSDSSPSLNPADNGRLNEQSDEHGDARHSRPSVARASSRKRKIESLEDNDDDYGDSQYKPHTRSRNANKRRASLIADTDTDSDIQPPNWSRRAKKARIDADGAGAASTSPSQVQTTPLPSSEKAAPESDLPKVVSRERWRPTWPSHVFVEEDLPQHHLGGTGGTNGRRPEDVPTGKRSSARHAVPDNRPWVCPMDGCQYTVWDHHRLSGQVWIRVHLQDHSDYLLPSAGETRAGSNK